MYPTIAVSYDKHTYYPRRYGFFFFIAAEYYLHMFNNNKKNIKNKSFFGHHQNLFKNSSLANGVRGNNYVDYFRFAFGNVFFLPA